MAYTIGGISGCHINPAITLAVALSKRMPWKDACGYWAGQFIGGIVGAAILALICSCSSFEMGGANGFGGVDGALGTASLATASAASNP